MSTSRRNLMWGLFTVLSAADLFLTWRLLNQRGTTVYESNPVAAWCLARFGWPGLAAYKAAAVLVVVAATAALFRRSPRAGGRVLTFGCAVLSGVVIYSFSLAGSARAWDDSPQTADVAAWRPYLVSARAAGPFPTPARYFHRVSTLRTAAWRGDRRGR